MTKTALTCLFLLCIYLTTHNLAAQVPVAVLPVVGSGDTDRLEQDVRRSITALGGLSVIGDNELKQVLDLHEKAQAMGSEAHDISKIKVAEYLVKTVLDGGKAGISAIAVNTNVEIYNNSFNYNAASPYAASLQLGRLSDAIMMDAYSAGRNLPSGVDHYMKSLNDLVQSLGMSEQASYPCLAFYSGGNYCHPRAGDKKLEKSAGVMLKEIRPRLARSRLIFGGIAPQANLVTVYIFADKLGKKTKHRFDFMDLPDGTLGITQYQPLQ